MIASVLFLVFVFVSMDCGADATDFCPASNANSSKILSDFFFHCTYARDRTHCPNETWFELFRHADRPKITKSQYTYTFVNIGFNKGYNFASWMNIFLPSWNMSTVKWFNVLKKHPSVVEAEVCGDCKECTVLHTQGALPSHEPRMRIVGIDLNRANLNIVNYTLSSLKSNISTEITKSVSIQLIHAAAGAVGESAGSDKSAPQLPKFLKIPNCPAGFERCKIPDPNAKPDPDAPWETDFVNVPVIAVDEIAVDLGVLPKPSSSSGTDNGGGTSDSDVKKVVYNDHTQQWHQHPHHQHLSTAHLSSKRSDRGRSNRKSKSNSKTSTSADGRGGGGVEDKDNVIDFLQIDTDGNDAEVLKSAKELLKHRKVRALSFEYHSLYPWRLSTLHGVIMEMDKYDLDCFYEGQGRLWPLTGSCWEPAYEFYLWSNVMCILRSDVWYAAVQPIVVTAARWLRDFPDGSVVKAPRMLAIYQISNGTLRAFANWEAFVSHGYDLDNVVPVCPYVVRQLFPIGEDIVAIKPAAQSQSNSPKTGTA
jgi:hypothetical protein